MNTSFRLLTVLLLLVLNSRSFAQSDLFHELSVTLDPATSRIDVVDTLQVQRRDNYRFSLNANLQLDSFAGTGYRIEEVAADDDSPASGDGRTLAPKKQYDIHFDNGPVPVTLRYAGPINTDARQQGAEYAQSFSATTGIISEQGVYLDYSSVWLPEFDDALMGFDLQVSFAAGSENWTAVSQGDALGANHWRSDQPMEEVYLVAAEFTTYRSESGGVELLAYLRQPDVNLATRYLDATERYLALYDSLLGDYPFGKFALVENFWETGYGMPSFTLLGEQIIRFPFILESSYPHEILHNWWGNSVYPEYGTGNWSEGLTAYLADHLFQEMSAAGAEYRKDMLARYRSAVSESADFPLSDFTSRNSAATQAVGYGKSLMLWHMLRLAVGDEQFLQGLRTLYQERRFMRTSYADIEAIFSRVSGRDLGAFFQQWVSRTGAPQLAVQVESLSDGRARIRLQQIQSGDVYQLEVPVALYYANKPEAEVMTVEMTDRSASVDIDHFQTLQAVVADPYFDVFRRLDIAEMPPTIRALFGAEHIQFIVPERNREQWLDMVEFFSADPAIEAEVVYAEDFRLLPSDKSVWVLGKDNPAQHFIEDAVSLYGVRFSDAGLSMLGSELPFANRSTVLTATHPDDPELTLGWIHADTPEAMPGLTEKLPHYGKYSYLSFVGSEPTNDVKGQWESPESPLLWLRGATGMALAPLPQRQALAQLPPKYLPDGFSRQVKAILALSQGGRGQGSAGLDAVADHLEQAFAEIGLQAPEGGYRQPWEARVSSGAVIAGSNIVGVLPGSDESLRDAPLVIGAHYDHLATSGETVFPGADDNASGVAVLLEVARKLERAFSPRRPIVFVAFSGEESGLLGSRAFVAAPPAPYTTQKLFAMINLDSVGRLEGRTLQVFASDSAYEWPFMAQGIGFTIGVPSQFPAQSVAGSDHVSFLEAGVPAIHLFSGLHNDYHRATDTEDKLDYAGMSDIALWLEEAVVYLAERDEPLRATLSNAPVRPESSSSARAASLGTIPEFNYAGDGVQISGVTPGGAGEMAGLQAGDVLLQFNGEVITDLQQYSNLIRAAAPGDVVNLRIRRGDALMDVTVELQAR
ncbi:MAG: M20/M25/M40 family metallo-hydrolase [Pseudomonadales bacterium]|nr:M20/M25/M40 family metallo-hydrolase [Pseudomonadales bacterium]